MIVGSVFAKSISSRAQEQNSLAIINIRAFIAIKHFAAKINSWIGSFSLAWNFAQKDHTRVLHLSLAYRLVSNEGVRCRPCKSSYDLVAQATGCIATGVSQDRYLAAFMTRTRHFMDSLTC